MTSLGSLVHSVSKAGPVPTDEQFTYIDLGSISAEMKQINSPGRVAVGDAPSRARQRVRAGDVLVSTVRPNLNGVAMVPDYLDGAIASTGFSVLRPNRDVLDPRYLFQFVRSTTFIRCLVGHATGASYPAVSDAIVRAVVIPLPALPEQRRIAAILDGTDDLKAMGRRSTDHHEQFLREQLNSALARSRSTTSLPLSAITTRITDGTHQPPKWASEGVPFLFVSNIVGGKIDYATERFVSRDTYEKLTRHAPIEVGDVLYSAVGSYGVPALVVDDRAFLFQRHVAHIKPRNDLVNSRYLRDVLASSSVRRQADRVAKGAAQKTVTLGDLSEFSIPMIDRDAQEEYAAFAAKSDQLRERLTERQSVFDELRFSLQYRAF